ncbi:TRAP transporter small permease [Marinovum sp. 2_MG-2023]|uniref:TRAP transporter small permease subunit n=1 Tax=unclassified Marinovum TaxID=2647166 RepID=UPI0026E3BBBC|nr:MULTISPECIES: TRAP transporter small permease [unclassified Marinovum]MDO6732947.1 TRAP transporter small permease [Marinovum sp. 2_MG-2023]MDO6781896.1 TRAP transporter small permease [Marinovum sp. 1_MG-2023]
MEKDNVWLGSARGPVKTAAKVFGAITAAIFAWLILNQFISEDAIGMHEMIRPQGRPIVAIMLASIFLTLLCTALFLSDRIGHIEPEPRGFFDILSLVTSRMAMIGIALIVVVMFYEVVSRYVFSRPTLWANEMSLWIAAVVFLFAGQYAMQQRSHIRIYVIYDMMPRWMQKTSDVISVGLIVCFTFSLVWGGYNDAKTRLLRMETFGTAWDPPIPGTMKAAILFIIVLVTIQAVSNLIADWNKAPEHHSPLDDIDETEIENIRKTLRDD